MEMERDGWGLAAMGATAMGCVDGGVSAQWGVTALERDGWGLVAMAETAMGRVGDGARRLMGRKGNCARRPGPGTNGRDGKEPCRQWCQCSMGRDGNCWSLLAGATTSRACWVHKELAARRMAVLAHRRDVESAPGLTAVHACWHNFESALELTAVLAHRRNVEWAAELMVVLARRSLR